VFCIDSFCPNVDEIFAFVAVADILTVLQRIHDGFIFYSKKQAKKEQAQIGPKDVLAQNFRIREN
jgi:hypothetical protein